MKRSWIGVGLVHGRELRPDDATRILRVREWRVTVHQLPRRRAERPHVDLERIVKAAGVGEKKQISIIRLRIQINKGGV